MNQTIHPSPLKKGDTIGVMAASCHVPAIDVETARKFIDAKGYKTFVHDQTFVKLNQSAGTAEEKANALNELFANPNIKAIFGARGGNRATTILDKIDYDLIAQNPKIFAGYSDTTALLNAIHEKTGLITFHGIHFLNLPSHPDYEDMVAILRGEKTDFDLSSCFSLRNGEAEGKILGGNLSMLQALIGTPYLPNLEGAILILEDVGDHLSRYDRMFCHLKNTGILKSLSALIIGSFSDVQDSQTNPFGFTLQECIEEHTAGTSYPILMNAPFGHAETLKTLPIGANATLKNGQLSFKAFNK